MATVAELLVKITADIDGVKKGLEEGAKGFDKFEKEASGSFDNAGKQALNFGDILKANIISGAVISGFKALAGAIGSALSGLKDFARQGIENASNLQEVQNVVDTTFGDGAAAIEAFAKSAATSFGMSELSAKQFTGTMGAMLKSTGLSSDAVLDMSQSLTGLAGDIASFYNLDPETAFEKLRSGISGETEPLKQLGINMSVVNLEAYALSQGITQTYKEMTQAEQTALRYNYILQATADAQGDFAKTSDSYANQQRIMQLNMENLATSIGSKLLPAANGLTTAFNALLSGEMNAADFGTTIGTIISDLANMIIAQLPALVNIGVEIINSLISGISSNLSIIIQSAINIATTLVSALIGMLPQLLQMGITILIELMKGIGEALPIIIPQIVDVVLTMIKTIYDNAPQFIEAGIDMLKGLVKGIIDSIPILVKMLPQIIDSMMKFFKTALPVMIQAGIELLVSLIGALPQIITAIVNALPMIIDGIVAGLMSAIPQLVEAGVQLFVALIKNLPQIIVAIVKALPQIIESIVKGLDSLSWEIVKAGGDLIKGLWNGISDAGAWLWNKISGFFGGITEKIKKFFGIGSPSKLFADYGQNMAEGLGIGYAKQMKDTIRMITAFNPRLTAAASTMITPPNLAAASAGAYSITAAPPAAAYAGSDSGVTINISGLSVREEADVQKISAQLYRLQQDRLRQRGYT